MDETSAIARLKRGDINGLEPLVIKYQTRAARTAFLITGDHALTEDIVQAAFLRAYEKIHQFDDQQPFGPWFLRIVANAALKAVQHQREQISLNASSPGDSLPLMIYWSIRRQGLKHVWRTQKLNRLSGRH